MEALAEQSGDLEEQIAVRSRDLSHGYHFLRIAELCLQHDAAELALQWAERGLAAFAERPDPRLVHSWPLATGTTRGGRRRSS
jgi:hypothetical protein